MKTNRRLTDEELARLIESGAGLDAMQFDSVDSLEAYIVAGNALELMDEADASDHDFSGVASITMQSDDFKPLAMCGFLGDESDDEDDAVADAPDTDESDS